MSNGKFYNVNGVRFSNDDNSEENEIDMCESLVDEKTFEYEGLEYETVKDITGGEAMALRDGKTTFQCVLDTPQWQFMSDAELILAAFVEGVPPTSDNHQENDKSVTVFMDSEKTYFPFGLVETAPFLELFWRNTGADCDEEEDDMVFPDGNKYHVILRD